MIRTLVVAVALTTLPVVVPTAPAHAASNATIVKACAKSFPRNRKGFNCLPRFTGRMTKADRAYLLKSLRKGTSIGVRYSRAVRNPMGVGMLVDQLKRGRSC